MTNDTLFLPDLSPVESFGLHAHFDGGVLILREIERRLKYADMLASCLHDARDPNRTVHPLAAMSRISPLKTTLNAHLKVPIRPPPQTWRLAHALLKNQRRREYCGLAGEGLNLEYGTKKPEELCRGATR